MPLDYRQFVQSVLWTFARQQGKSIVVEKTPNHLFSLATIFQWFPLARVICVVRDGRDVVRSLQNFPLQVNLGKAGWPAFKWRRAARQALQYQGRHSDRFMMVKMEDLLAAPVEQISRLDRFLGVEFEASQLDTEKKTSVVPAREQGWKDNATGELDRSRIGAWRRNLTQEEVWRINSMSRP